MIRLSVPDMSCAHCKASVEAALSRLVPSGDVTVDLANRRVDVSAEMDAAVLIKALDDIGYPATASRP